MKKLILILILLILAGGAGFYFGWINIEPGTFGIAHSTIAGTINYPIESGRLNWVWQKLIPKSFHLYIIEKEPYAINIDASFPLPGSEELKEFGSFSLKVKVAIQYSIDFDTAKVLLENGILVGVNDFFRDGFYTQIDETASSFILENMVRYSLFTESFNYSALEDLKEMLKENVYTYAGSYRLKSVKANITFREIPQIQTYKKALNRYFEYMETMALLKEKDLKREAEYQMKQKEDDVEIIRLRKYGELISQYPDLLKYFYIQKFGEKIRVLVLPQDERTGFPRMLEPYEEYEKESFIPLEQAPEETPSFPEPEALEETAEKAPEETELMQEEAKKDKWYQYLKFWKYMKKD